MVHFVLFWTKKCKNLKKNLQYIPQAGISTGYQEKPCLDPLDPLCPDSAPNKNQTRALDVGAAVTGGCYGFAGRYMHWPEDLVLGNIERNITGHVVKLVKYNFKPWPIFVI